MKKLELITSSLIEIGVLSGTEVPDNSDAAVAATILDQMLDSLQADRLWIFAIQRMLFSPATLKQTYTLGPGGDFNAPRPAKITRYGILNLSNPIQPIELGLDSLTEAQWMAVPVKNIASALPQKVWDDQQFPLRNLNYFPVPNVQVNFTIYQWAALSSWPDYVTDVTFPPGYAKALRLSLAIELAPSFGATAMVTPLLVKLAEGAINRIKAMNAPLIDLKCDPMLQDPQTGIYNWLTDEQVGSGS